MAALPALKRSATSGARMAVLDRPITRVYANRPMWQTPERKHWLNEMANQNTYLTHAVGIAGCMVAAQFIVVNFGGSGYGAPPPPQAFASKGRTDFAVGRCHRSSLWRGGGGLPEGRAGLRLAGRLPCFPRAGSSAGRTHSPTRKAGGKSVHHSVATSSMISGMMGCANR